MKKRYWIAGAATLAVAAKLLTRPRDADWNRNRRVVFHSDHSRFVDIDGVRVHYQEAGDPNAPVLVLIHGFASSTLVWSKVFLPLAEIGFRVIAIDMVGFGYSGKPRNGEYTIAGQASLLNSLLDRLDIKRATLAGVERSNLDPAHELEASSQSFDERLAPAREHPLLDDRLDNGDPNGGREQIALGRLVPALSRR